MTLQIYGVTASATIERGVVSNRVKKVRKTPVRPKDRTVRYRKDTSTLGKLYTKICISIPVDELAVMDAFAYRVQMARSELIRQAVKHFRAKVMDGLK